MPEIRDTDWAYAAGFVDGEGCIAITRSFSTSRGRFYYGVAVVVVNGERSVLDWMQSLWGGWVVSMGAGRGNTRASWSWRSPSGIPAALFLHGVSPWLRIKNAQCGNALAMIEVLKRSRYTLGRKPLPHEWMIDQERLYWRQRELNHRGNEAFIAAPKHSPQKIKRSRLSPS